MNKKEYLAPKSIIFNVINTNMLDGSVGGEKPTAPSIPGGAAKEYGDYYDDDEDEPLW